MWRLHIHRRSRQYRTELQYVNTPYRRRRRGHHHHHHHHHHLCVSIHQLILRHERTSFP